MKWNKIYVKNNNRAIDYISGLMIELGIDGIQIEDNVPLSEEDKKAMFIDYLPTLPKDDGTAYISFYTEEDNDDEALLHKVREKLIDVSERTLEKLKEMSPEIASTLQPIIPDTNSLKWTDVFKKVSICGDENIPINKRGSGVKRLILLNFFRAEAERRLQEKVSVTT